MTLWLPVHTPYKLFRLPLTLTYDFQTQMICTDILYDNHMTII